MADFIETSKSRNAKRTYDKIADAETAAGVGGSASTDSTEYT